MRIIKGDIKTTTKGKVKTERKTLQDKTKYDEKRQHTKPQHNTTQHTMKTQRNLQEKEMAVKITKAASNTSKRFYTT